MYNQLMNCFINNLAQVQPPATTPSGANINPFMIIFLAVYFLISLCLVTTILSQTTKSEGLSGTIGGRTESVFKGKGTAKSLEDRLEQITTILAVGFLVLSAIISIVGF